VQKQVNKELQEVQKQVNKELQEVQGVQDNS
jgi:hypothetical protein